jgi:hypothetical protein
MAIKLKAEMIKSQTQNQFNFRFLDLLFNENILHQENSFNKRGMLRFGIIEQKRRDREKNNR